MFSRFARRKKGQKENCFFHFYYSLIYSEINRLMVKEQTLSEFSRDLTGIKKHMYNQF